MSYLVLARKWRPQGFDDLIGQEPISRILKNAIEQNKTAHAYIFSGPRGVGKTSTARILAKALNCEKGPTPTPCSACHSCTSIKDGTSIDVLEIDGASSTGVDNIRDLREGIKYTPLGAKYKIYIIDEAHMLSQSAFNALLKTLEEPPTHAIFVLATTAPHKIPATIFSRCQHLPFRRISTQRIKERLKHIISKEDIKISDSALELVARAADGSMRDSLTILDQVASFSSEINESDVKDLLGVADIEILSEVSVAVIEGSREKLVKLVAELVDRGTDIKAFTENLTGFFRNLLVAKVVQKPEELLELSENEMKVMRGILPKVSADLLTLMLSELIRAAAEVRASFAPRLSLEMALIKASFLSSMPSVKDAIEKITSFSKGLPIAESRGQKSQISSQYAESKDIETDMNRQRLEISPQKSEVKTEPLSVKPELPNELDGDSLLNAVMEKIEDPRISSKLSKAKPLLKDGILILTFNSNDAEIFAEPIRKNSTLIEGIASEIRKNPIKVQIELHKKKIIGKNDLRAKALEDPAIKEIIDLFDGRIIDVKLKENTANGS